VKPGQFLRFRAAQGRSTGIISLFANAAAAVVMALRSWRDAAFPGQRAAGDRAGVAPAVKGGVKIGAYSSNAPG